MKQKSHCMKSICLHMTYKSTTQHGPSNKKPPILENNIRHAICVCVWGVGCVVTDYRDRARNFHFIYVMHLMGFPLFCFICH